MSDEQPKKTCFLISPIGGDDSDPRVHADWLLDAIVDPVFSELGYEVLRADRILIPGQIDLQIIRLLLNADVVVADLSFHNPNVMYELGIRHTVQKPVIHMHLEGEKIPFDITTYRSIPYSRRRYADLAAARQRLKAFAEEIAKADYVPLNPVIVAQERYEIEQRASTVERQLSQRIEQLETLVAGLSGSLVRLPPLVGSQTTTLIDLTSKPRVIRIKLVKGLSAQSREVDLIKTYVKHYVSGVDTISIGGGTFDIELRNDVAPAHTYSVNVSDLRDLEGVQSVEIIETSPARIA